MSVNEGTRSVSAPLLSVADVSLRYGGLDVLKSVALEVAPNQVVGLIGPNGAGKSALLNCISRVYQPEPGARIAVHGDATYTSLPPYRIAHHGVARTFQGLQLAAGLSVFDNIACGLATKAQLSMRHALLQPWSYIRESAWVRRRVREVALRCGVVDVLDRLPAQLPLGVQRRVDLARALAGSPALLLLDEPASGLTHQERPLIAELIEVARQSGNVSVVWVEHDLDLVFSHSDRVVVLRNGERVDEGDPGNAAVRQRLVASYYG